MHAHVPRMFSFEIVERYFFPQNIMELCNDRYEEMMKTKLDTEDSPKKTSRKKKNPMTDKMHTVSEIFRKAFYIAVLPFKRESLILLLEGI